MSTDSKRDPIIWLHSVLSVNSDIIDEASKIINEIDNKELNSILLKLRLSQLKMTEASGDVISALLKQVEDSLKLVKE